MTKLPIKTSLNNLLIVLCMAIVIILPNATTVSRIAKVAFAAIAILYIMTRRKFYWSYYLTWLVMTVVLAFVSILWAESRDYAVDGAQTVFLNAVCVVSLLQLIYNNSKWKKTVYGCCAIFPLIRFASLIPEYGTAVFGGLRNIGQDASYNALGTYAGFGAAFCVLLIFQNKKKSELWKVFFCINVLLCVITMSRKAVLYLVIPLLIYYLLTGRNTTKKIKRAFTVVFLLIAAYAAIMNIPVLYKYVGSGLQSIMSFVSDTGRDDSAAGRAIRIQYGLEWFNARPWLGYGVRNYNYMFSKYVSAWARQGMVIADNNYIDTLVNYGIIGFVLYYSMHLKTISICLKNFKRLSNEKIMMFGILITLLVCDYGVSSYIYLHSQTFLAIAVYGICERENGWAYKKKKTYLGAKKYAGER